MSPRNQIISSVAIVGLAVVTVGVYAALGGEPAGQGVEAMDHAAMVEAAASAEATPVRLDAAAARRIGITFATAQRRLLRRDVQTVGSVTYDETRLATVSPKVEGWIERLYVDFTGAPVQRGQPLMEVYAPMLVAAQEELILARRLVADQRAAGGAAEAIGRSEELLESARRRLAYLDVAPDEIARIERSGQPRRTVAIRSPASGVVVEKTAVHGARVMPGMDLFRIADLSRVWVDGEIYEKDMGVVRVGQAASVRFEAYPGETFRATVSYVYPSVSLDARTGRVRLALANPGLRLKPGMYARIELEAGGESAALLVPRAAVHSTGNRSLVFVRQPDGSLLPTEVTLGRASGDDVEVLAGLAEGAVVVSSANFLVDAESNLGTSIGSVPGADGHAAAGHGTR